MPSYVVHADANSVAAIFVGDPIYSGGQSTINAIKNSGYNTVIIGLVHPHPNGDLYLNNTLVCSGGQYVGTDAARQQWATLKTGPTSVNRVEIAIGGGSTTDFQNMNSFFSANDAARIYEFEINPPNQPTVNLCKNKPATANQYVDFYGPDLAVDGLQNTKWVSNVGMGNQWLQVDLGSRQNVSTWAIGNAGLGASLGYGDKISMNTSDFKIQSSDDGNTWTDQATITGNTQDIVSGAFPAGLYARYFRLYITKPTQNIDTKNIFKQNLQALINATGADAVNFDDEDLYSSQLMIDLGNMVNSMGKKVTLCPFDHQSTWAIVKNTLGSIVDRVYLQGYGGTVDPGSWKNAMGMPVVYGFNTAYSPENTVATALSSLDPTKVSFAGAFIWNYDQIQNNISVNTPAGYAKAIRTYFDIDTNQALNKYVWNNGSNVTPPSNAVDGQKNTLWTSSNVSGDKYLQVDLGEFRTVSRFVARHAGAAGLDTSLNTKNFKLEYSMDGTNWFVAYTVSGNSFSVTDAQMATKNARYFRLNITTPTQTTDQTARIVEFELYGY
ncbi:discoidin domain-containing protein [Pelosinus baikalensis]|uniref:Discoidin domain-containing protein n=1 Tax=Pelosinus baikalensis TaxID=2892015 RepID=A0ABS8HTW8_9FIRM|nr:discoidin domain-containing protein [Pelosinus baikalensis]MCC5465668.1 discoidin domain-containing protein [Pelosinus baikalensis]